MKRLKPLVYILLLLAPLHSKADNSLGIHIPTFEALLAAPGAQLRCRNRGNSAFGYLFTRGDGLNLNMQAITENKIEDKVYAGVISRANYESLLLSFRDEYSGHQGGVILEFRLLTKRDQATLRLPGKVYMTEFEYVQEDGREKERYTPMAAIALDCDK